MNNRTLQTSGIIVFLLIIALFAVSNVHAASDDALLNMLPNDCIFCVRVNNFNGSLGKLDQYLAGASPIPVSLAMMVNMQLGAIIGDPMLTGIDQGEDFAIFAMPPQGDKMEPLVGILIPVTDYKTFVETNPNCKEGEGGVAIFSDPNLPMGSFVLAEAGNGKYALVVPESEKATLSILKEAIKNSSKPLAQKVTAAQAKAAATAPVWAYANLAGLYDKYNEDALAALETAQEEMAKNPGPAEMMGMMEFYFEVLPEILEEFGGEVDSLTIALTPEPTILSIDIALQAKDGTYLADVFIENPKATGNYTMTGYLDDNHAVNALAKMNIQSTKKMYDMFFDIMDDAADDSKFKEQIEEFKAALDKTYDAMGDEVAFSFSYAGGMPPFKFQEVVEIKKPDVMREYMQNSMGFVNELYKSMGIPMELKYEQDTSTYKGTSIDTLSFTISDSDDPNNMMQKELKKIYGTDGFKYYFAQSPEKFYMVMGPDSEQTLKALIDRSASTSAPSGDIKIAMDALQNTPYNDFVCSVNIIKLMKGLGEMMQSMSGQACMGPAGDMFSGLENIPSQSCLVMGGKVADGAASLRIAMPKQHLIEVVAMAMQIQQKMRKVQQEMMQNQQPDMTPQTQMMGGGSSQMPASVQQTPQNPLQSWVGKPAPDIKMVDLDGKIHRVSRLKGKKVILDFWATWCPPCKKAIPDLIKLADSNGSDLVILGLSKEPADKLTPFVKETKMNYPVITYNDKDVSAPYSEVTAIPTLFLIDSEGIIQDVIIGYHEPEELQSRLKNLK